MTRSDVEPSAQDLKIIHDKLIMGVVSRASTLSLIFALAFSIYSFTSLAFIRNFNPQLTTFENTWPRLVFNGVPLLAMGFYFKSYGTRTCLKAWMWTLGLPIVFLFACLIQVWPLIWAGKTEVYYFVHSANVFILTTALIVIAPPPRLMFAQVGAFVLLIVVPVSTLFILNDDFVMLRFALGDMLIVIPASSYVSHVVHKLRYKIALFDLNFKKVAAPFLGSALTDAIYNQKSELLEDRTADAVVVQMDMRGYTIFHQTNDLATVKAFMTSYHAMVSRFVGQNGGYWHKSVGDAQLITFGAMEIQEDLSQIPGLQNELSTATLRKKRRDFENALNTIRSIVTYFDQLKEKFDLDDNIGLGIAVTSGEIEVRVQGDALYKRELDIDGAAVIRCSRLEQYSKTIRAVVAPDSSLLVVSPELTLFVSESLEFRKWSTTKESLQIRNYGEIEYVYFHAFIKNETARSKGQSAA